MKVKQMKAKQKNNNNPTKISLHFIELKKRLTIVAIILAVAFLACFQFAPAIVEHFVCMADMYGYKLVYLAPSELFGQYLKVAIVSAIVVGLPVILYQTYAFCRPGLKTKEKRYFVGTMLFGILFFVTGVVFAYFTILPFMLRFFIEINESSIITATISVANYIGFLISTLFLLGVVFELPVVITLLSILGIINSKLLISIRKPVIVIIFFICAIITPPDIVSQFMVALPMILLYELSTRISMLVEKKKK